MSLMKRAHVALLALGAALLAAARSAGTSSAPTSPKAPRAPGKGDTVWPLLPTVNFTRPDPAKPRAVDLVVIHTAELPEKPTAAHDLAAWLAGPSRPNASWHYAVDGDDIVQSVLESDVAWHAPGANHNGIGIEHAGYARQSAADWNDPYSVAMLRLSAELTAGICSRWGIPVELIDAQGLKDGKRGITSHLAVSQAFKKSDHGDPGKFFPWDRYLSLVRSFQGSA
jgi:N-acetyl-anhydromuramyl-L-alanine amidase AmpD